jgi:stage V sporulation protein G
MEITEVRVKLMEDSDDRLLGFCSVTFDNCFVVRDLKIIEGLNGPFVAMPSRKLTMHCPHCGKKNELRALFCNNCGKDLPEERASRDPEGRVKLYADIAHPINSACREMIQDRVLAEFEKEVQRSSQPGYTSRYDLEYDEVDDLPTASPPRDSQPFGSDRTTKHVDTSQPMPPPPHPPAGQRRPGDVLPQRPNSTFGAGIFDD